MATYKIIEKVDGPFGKFACRVSFNGKDAHYHEIESLDPAEIDAQLQATADADEAASAQAVEIVAAVEAVSIDKDGQIVVPAGDVIAE